VDSRPGLDNLVARIGVEADRLGAGVWSERDDERVSLAFEQCATAALRAPVLAERSIVLRRIAKRITPRALVPTVKRLVKLADATSRRVVEMLSSRRSRS
jgi:nuclear transport factor 2 (NTF2) superfamily protein